jgi:mannose-6-phosphate isomerase-like protein (cupin superfamily)
MKVWTQADLNSANESFQVRHTTARSQFATMVLSPGETSGEFGNEHGGADQWLYVLSGVGEAKGESGVQSIGPGDLVLIPAPEKHQFRCTGDAELRTITFYAPPGY